MQSLELNPNKLRTRFVVARNQWCADYTLAKVRDGLLRPEKVLHLTRDAALEARNKMRNIHHASYSVFEVYWTQGSHR